MRFLGYKTTGYGPLETHVIHTLHPDERAQFAMELMRNNSILLVKPNGETSAGHVDVKLMPTADIAERACNMALHAFAEFEKRGWMLEVPEPSEAQLTKLNLDK